MVYVVLGIQPRASCIPDKHTANQATSPVPEPEKRVSSGEAAEAMTLMLVVMSLLWESLNLSLSAQAPQLEDGKHRVLQGLG